MSETAAMTVATFAGMLLGAVFFGGLWWTIRKALFSSMAALWFFGSLLTRTAIVIGGFYFVARGDWRRMVCCVVGFLVMRLMAARLTRTDTRLEGSS